MEYSKLTDEAYKLYMSFFNSGFDSHQAFELTKFCVKEFAIFKTMITDEYGNQI